MKNISSGLLLYKQAKGSVDVFLVHPGGPFFKNKDKGYWSIPKGLPNEGESLENTAKREFLEETGFLPDAEMLPLGSVKQKSGKTVWCWAMEGDTPAAWELKCNSFRIEWPPRSGKMQDFPEVDIARFFEAREALEYINEAQGEFVRRIMKMIG
jgi:predicted NUDIX family NTP pyrophosphohydrolase